MMPAGLVLISALGYTRVVSSASFAVGGRLAKSAARGALTQAGACDGPPHPSMLPGDPSLVLTTNVDLGEKEAFMKQVSAAIAAATGKPESYVAVCVLDKQSVIFGGSDAPCAIGVLYSIGAVEKANNKRFMEEITPMLGEYGVEADRIYVNFFDVPREKVGWNGATFAG